MLLLEGVYLIVAGWIIHRCTTWLQRLLSVWEQLRMWTPLLVTVFKVYTWQIVIVSILESWGINLDALTASFSIVGVISAFALKDPLSNFAAGLLLATNDHLDTGLTIQIKGYTGTIRSLDIMSLTLTTPDNQRIVIPNRLLLDAPMTIINGFPSRGLGMTFRVHPNADTDDLLQRLTNLVLADPLVLRQPEPLIEISDITEQYLVITVSPYVRKEDFGTALFRIRQQCAQLLASAFDEPPPYPHRALQSQPSRALPPPQNLPETQ